MRTLRIVLMGVSGCGKTTVGSALAQHLGLPFLEGDSLHPQRNIELMRAGVPLTDADRSEWLDTIAARLQALPADEGLVVSCSALRRSYRDRLRRACPDLRFVHLQGARQTIAQRLSQRQGHYMPGSLLASQFATLEPPQPDEAVLCLDIAAPTPALVERITHHFQEHTA